MELEASLSWLALTMTPGIAARLSARLLREYGSPEGVFRASLTGIESCNVPAPVAQAIFKKQMFWRAEKEVDALRKIGGKMVNWKEPEYPQSLLQIYDPPVLLYVRGDAGILNSPSLSIVGTRRPTIYGTQMAERMGRDLASRGLTIVSGLARGIDAIAHKGRQPTWRPRHRRARARGSMSATRRKTRSCMRRSWSAERSSASSPPAAIRRPRISRYGTASLLVCRSGVVIVEGKQYSGSLITARLAMEFGREVFGVPGNVTQEVSFAPNLLIKQGAKLVTNAEDVIEELPTPIRAALVKAEAVESEQRNLLLVDGLTPVQRKLYELLSAEESRHIDDLVDTSGLNSSEVLATLFDLEMKGIIRQLPGKQFSKVLL